MSGHPASKALGLLSAVRVWANRREHRKHAALVALLSEDWRGRGPITLTLCQLADAMATSLATARRAVQDLERDGLVVVSRGYVSQAGKHMPSRFVILYAVLLPMLGAAVVATKQVRAEEHQESRKRTKRAQAKAAARRDGEMRSLPVNRPGKAPGGPPVGVKGGRPIAELAPAALAHIAGAGGNAPFLQGVTKGVLALKNFRGRDEQPARLARHPYKPDAELPGYCVCQLPKQHARHSHS